MSAFIVSKRHIDALIASGLNGEAAVPLQWRVPGALNVTGRLDHLSATEVGRMLWLENIRGFNARYEGRHQEDIPTEEVESYSFPALRVHKPTVVEALKLVQCYAYQSSDSEDWEETEAYAFCQALKEYLIYRLPGYEEAPWSI